jgi:hypothetical protein
MPEEGAKRTESLSKRRWDGTSIRELTWRKEWALEAAILGRVAWGEQASKSARSKIDGVSDESNLHVGTNNLLIGLRARWVLAA